MKIEDLFQDDNNENIPLHQYNREELIIQLGMVHQVMKCEDHRKDKETLIEISKNITQILNSSY